MHKLPPGSVEVAVLIVKEKKGLVSKVVATNDKTGAVFDAAHRFQNVLQKLSDDVFTQDPDQEQGSPATQSPDNDEEFSDEVISISSAISIARSSSPPKSSPAICI